MIRRFIDRILSKSPKQKGLKHGHTLSPKKIIKRSHTSILSYCQKML